MGFKLVTILICLSLSVLYPVISYAQFSESTSTSSSESSIFTPSEPFSPTLNGPDDPPDDPIDTPLDGGIVFLLAIGIIYGIRKYPGKKRILTYYRTITYSKI